MPKLVKYILVLFLLLVSAGVYLVFFTDEEVKARKVRSNMERVKVGQSSQEVIHLLGKPDTKSNDGAFLYYLGFGAADFLWIYVRNDTVVDVVSSD